MPITEYTTSIGLATKRTTLKSPDKGSNSRFFDINVNILDGKFRKPKAKPVAMKYLVMTVLLVAVIACLFPLYQASSQTAGENSMLGAELENIQRETNLAALINEETMLTEEIISETLLAAKSLETANNFILGIRGDFNTRLQQVTWDMPVNTSFTSIEIRKDVITIKGETDNIFTVIEYAAALEAEGIFKQVRITELDETYVTPPGTGEDESPLPQVYVVTFEIEGQISISE